MGTFDEIPIDPNGSEENFKKVGENNYTRRQCLSAY